MRTSFTASGPPRPWASIGECRSGRDGRRRRLGAGLRRRDRRAALGVRLRTRRTPSGPRRATTSSARPCIYDGVVYIANGQDPEHGEGVGHMYAIDGNEARRHHRRTGAIWHYEARSGGPSRRPRSSTASSTCPTSAASSTRIDLATGEPLWVHDTFAAVWSSPMIIDGRIYLGRRGRRRRRAPGARARGERHKRR